MTFLEFISRNSKRIIYVLYSILLVYGVALLLWGVVDQLSTSHDTNVMTFGMWIAVGLVSLLNSLMGFYGTVTSDPCVVSASITIMFLTCVIQIMVIIVRISMPFTEAKEQKANLYKLFMKEEDDDFHQLEIEYECCGVISHEDYEQKFDPSILFFPASCCGKTDDTLCKDPYPQGCHIEIMEAKTREEIMRALIFLSSACFKFVSAIVIAILTIWGDDLV